jgi:ribosomal protein L7/L12
MPESYSIILSGGTPGDVAPAMSKLFGIDQKLAGQIAGASPIVLVEDLNEDQAAGVRGALDELVTAGADIALKAGNVGSIPKVGWGGVPKIAGKPATDYTAPQPPPGIVSAPGTFCCPECGANFKLIREGAAAAGAAQPAPAAPAATKSPAQMGVKDSGFEEIPLPDALKALESPPDLPDVPEVPSAAAPAPGAGAPAAPVGGAIPASQVKPGHSAPMLLEDFEAGLASDDNLLADLDDGLPDVPDEPAKPMPPKAPIKARAKSPLVEVSGMDDIEVMPLGGAAKAAPAAKPAAPKAAPKAKKAAPAAKAKPAKAKAKAPPGDLGGDPNEKVNIFANKSSNPKMVELLSKIRGVSPEEAEDLASKPLVTVARNISRKQAEVIRKKFNESRISVRLSPARASQRMKPVDD